jgi:hypothetical protein
MNESLDGRVEYDVDIMEKFLHVQDVPGCNTKINDSVGYNDFYRMLERAARQKLV